MKALVPRRLPSAQRLLPHILENPRLLAAVRELSGPALGRLIERVGLEDAAELVALASSEQLARVFDEDLWREEPGVWEERFDAGRFALWLHAFVEAGEDALVKRLLELPFELLVLGVQRSVLVIDIDALGVELAETGDEFAHLEKALESCLYEEWEEFRLIARDTSVWDELLNALFALDRDHHELLRKILERCAALSSEYIEDNGGLYEVLTSDEALETDVRADRDERRAEQGFVSMADARAFLELARLGHEPDTRDAIARAYFRSIDHSRERALASPPAKRASRGASQLMRLLGEAQPAELRAEPAFPRLGKQPGRHAKKALVQVRDQRKLLEAALSALSETRPELYGERMEELGFLANVLLSAPHSDRQRPRPVEALELAVTLCEFGLMRALAARGKHATAAAAGELVAEVPADRLFREAFGAYCAGRMPEDPRLALLQPIVNALRAAPKGER